MISRPALKLKWKLLSITGSLLVLCVVAYLILHRGLEFTFLGGALFLVVLGRGAWVGRKLVKDVRSQTATVSEIVVHFATAATLSYSVFLGLLYFLQDKLLFPPVPGDFQHCELAKNLGYEAIESQYGGTTVRMYVKRRREAVGTLLFFHGNGELACSAIYYAEQLWRLPLNFALVEYSGYGGGTEGASQTALLRNAEGAYDFLKQKGLAEGKIFALGRSLGTGVATYLASKRRVDGLVLISPYPSIAEVAAFQYPMFPTRMMIRSPFPASEWAAHVTAPVLAFHGTADPVIPFQLAQEEIKKFSSSARLVPLSGFDHNDIIAAEDGLLWKPAREFFKALVK